LAVAVLLVVAGLVDHYWFPDAPLPVLYVPALLVAATFSGPVPVMLLGCVAAVMDFLGTPVPPLVQRLLGASTLVAVAWVAALLARRRLDAQRSAQRAERLHHQLDEFLRMVTHELGTPLQSLRFRVELAQREQLPTVEIAPLRRAVEQINRLVSDLRDCADIEHHSFRVSPEPVDLVPCVRGVVDELRLGAGGRTIRCETPPSLVGSWDPVRLRQVVTNLLTNALKYSEGAVEVSVSARPDEAVVDVADHGPGIAPQDIGRLFKPYERLGVRRQPGSGLGLFIARSIVEAHAGRLDVHSAAEQGTVFSVHLPTCGPSGAIPAHA
jgi:signal transduction histidine kinase